MLIDHRNSTLFIDRKMSPFFKFFVILLASGSCYSTYHPINDYGNLISQVHDWYGKSEIMFLHSKNNVCSQNSDFLVKTISDLSDRNILSSVMDLEQLQKTILFNVRGFNRLLIVIIIRAMKEDFDFQNLTEGINMMSTMWMMIFANDDNDNEICNFCYNPKNKLFQLKNDKTFVVSCCNSTKLEKWSSKDGEDIQALPFGKLVHGKYQWVQKKSTFHRRSSSSQLRIVTIENSPDFWEENGVYKGFLGEILTRLVDSVEISIAPPILINSSTKFNEIDSKQSDALFLIQNGKADLGVFLSTMTNRQFDSVDFTIPLRKTITSLFIRKPNFRPWYTQFQIFGVNVWLAIAATILAGTFLLTFIQYKLQQERFSSVISENCFNIFGIFCQQGLSAFPIPSSMRITYHSIFLTAVILLAAHSANVISILTTSLTSLPFNNFEEFTKQNAYRLIVKKETTRYELFANAQNPLENEIFKLMQKSKQLPTNISAISEIICNEKVAYYGSLIDFRNNSRSNCEIIRIGEYITENWIMILKRGSPFKESINQHIIKLYNNGMLEELAEQYFILNNEFSPEYSSDQVSFTTITPFLGIFCGGIIISLLILFLELTFSDFKLILRKFKRHSEYSSKPTWTTRERHPQLRKIKDVPIMEYYP